MTITSLPASSSRGGLDHVVEPVVGVVFRPQCPPERLPAVAAAAERAGVAQLWLWEDCFLASGPASAAIALARTERLTVGVGLFPVPLRNPAVLAMEIATLARTFPGRVVPVVGHGVQDWMDQVGARVASPMTLLAEHTDAVRALLRGETVDVEGRYVHLDRVTLDGPPGEVPPLLVGARGPRTLALAGALGDGVLLDHGLDVDAVRASLEHVARGHADRPGSFLRAGYVQVPDADTGPPWFANTARVYGAAGLDVVVFVPPEADPDPEPVLEALAAR